MREAILLAMRSATSYIDGKASVTSFQGGSERMPTLSAISCHCKSGCESGPLTLSPYEVAAIFFEESLRPILAESSPCCLRKGGRSVDAELGIFVSSHDHILDSV